MLSNSLKSERGEEAAKERLEASRVLFIMYKERSLLYNIKVQIEAVKANREASASYLCNLKDDRMVSVHIQGKPF